MGYTTTDKCHEDMSLPQTPENVRKVLDRAGWTVWEACNQVFCSFEQLSDALSGEKALPDGLWKDLLDVCGKRVFDAP
jgi:hypothetical protein